jgi:hypothetical protein
MYYTFLLYFPHPHPLSPSPSYNIIYEGGGEENIREKCIIHFSYIFPTPTLNIIYEGEGEGEGGGRENIRDTLIFSRG